MDIKVIVNNRELNISSEDSKMIQSIVNKNLSITDRIKTIEDVLEYHGMDSETFFVKKYGSMERKYQILKLIELTIEALNDGWKPDFTDHNQRKYYPYFEYKNDSLCFDDCFTYRIMLVPSALLLKSEKLARYIGEEFIDLYKEYYSYGFYIARNN
jgi:hypothetical protein